MNCLPVLGQLTLRLVRSARLFGRVLPLYTCPMLCFSIGPSFNTTETAMSWVAPHLLQRAKRLYRTAKFFMLIRLFQQDTTCSVLACHGRRFLEAWVNFSVSLPAKRLVRNIWQLVAGLTGLGGGSLVVEN